MLTVIRGCLLLCFLATECTMAFSQNKQNKTQEPFIMKAAGAEYEYSPLAQTIWGKLYRREWTTPVRLPVAMLDTLVGGVKPVKAGGGNQTKSLQVEDRNGRRYALRTVNKTLGKVLPDEFLGTFMEDMVNDKVSMSHPYSAAATAYLAQRAKMFHTTPRFVYLPKQPALDTFQSFGDQMYLFEEKVDGNWEDADNLGNFKDYTNTFKVMKAMQSDNKYQANQRLFARSRLFDMLINDWDRHEDQWEWGLKQEGNHEVFTAVPQDRDQAFFSYDGVMLNILFPVSGMKYFQPFDEKIKDVEQFNWEQRNLDRFFTNKLSLQDWQEIARSLQVLLTNEVIETSLKQMPKEIIGFSDDTIASKLKGRRDRLVDYASMYYRFIAKEVDIVGSSMPEHYEIKRLNARETQVNVFATNNGIKSSQPFYSRVFKTRETNELRLYGIGGNDKYNVAGRGNKMTIRLIGGADKDTMALNAGKVHVYDNHDNYYTQGSRARYHLKNDSSVHEYNYASFTYDKKGIKPTLFFNTEDRLFVGLGYGSEKYKWRKDPFAYQYDLGVNYSLSQRAFSVNYNGLYPNVVGKWDLLLAGGWDAIRWTNFFGLGNESKFLGDDIDFYRARSEEWYGSAGLVHKIGRGNININALYQRIRIINDSERFTGKTLAATMPDLFTLRRFAGGELLYNLHRVNDSIVPTAGFLFTGRAAYLQNVKQSSRAVGDFLADLRLFVPIIPKISIAFIIGGQTVTGRPEFYQNASIGGSRNVRGFRRTRYWGKSAFYNSNELRYIKDVKSYLYNGKFGFLTFFDVARVWLPGEKSTTWHKSYGGGILLAPFNKVAADITYAISKDESLIQLRVTTPIR